MEVNTPNQIENSASVLAIVTSQPRRLKSKKSILLYILGALVLVSLLGGGGYYLGVQSSGTEPAVVAEITPIQSVVTQIPADVTALPTADPHATWKEYESQLLDVKFRLPPVFSKYGQFDEKIMASETPFNGKSICATLVKSQPIIPAPCTINGFGMGVISEDYDVGRGGVFSDLGGFVVKNGRYYLRSSSEPLPEKDAEFFKNKYGLEMIILKSHFVVRNGVEEMPPIYDFNGQYIGALINHKNTLTQGFAVQMDLRDGSTREDFKEILNTFKPL